MPSLHAALMVDWGGNYVSSSVQYSNPNPSNGLSVTQYGGFSSGAPLLLSPGASYSGTSATFYGEVARTGGTGTFTNASGTIPTAVVVNNGNADQLQVKLDGTGNTASALFLWKQTDFLNGLNSGTLNLAAGSTVSTTVDSFSNGLSGRAVLRLSSGSYYISSAIFSGIGTSTLDLVTDLAWFNYNPASAFGTIGSSFNLVSGGVISNVTEVGFYTGVISSGANAVRVSSIEFNYATIPEPSTFALLSGLGILLLVRRQRKRHAFAQA